MAGKVLKRLIIALAIAIEGLYAMSAKVLRLSIIATSQDEFLRSLVAGFGMEAHGGVPSTVTARLIRYGSTSSSLTVPAGLRVGSVSGATFRTVSAVTLGAGIDTAEVNCLAERPGISGNIQANTMLFINKPAGIDAIENRVIGRGGADPEQDSAIKARVPGHIESLHRATIPATEYAIRQRVDQYPEVRGFVTRRNYGTPGYFLGVMSDYDGSVSYRPGTWQLSGNGVYFVNTALTDIAGLVAFDWPCKRFGVYGRSLDGEEQWKASAFVAEVEQGNWRFCHDRGAGRLYARADGRDLNQLKITIVAGVLLRVLRELERQWAANGVGLDVIAPFEVRAQVSVLYSVDAGYSQTTTTRNVRSAVESYISSLRMGQNFDLDGAYANLALVAGASSVVLESPTDNISVPVDSVFKADGNVVVRVR